jgi:DNA-binding MarR family transcriptional regulator
MVEERNTTSCFYKSLLYQALTKRATVAHVPGSSSRSDPKRWSQRLSHVLWETYTRVLLLGDAEFAGSELSLPAIGALDMIATWPGATVAELSRRTPKTPQAISQVVGRLERLGYVERRLGPGRGVGLHITDAGIKARSEGHRREDLLEVRVRDALGEQLYADLERLLDQARDSLNRSPSTEDADRGV